MEIYWCFLHYKGLVYRRILPEPSSLREANSSTLTPFDISISPKGRKQTVNMGKGFKEIDRKHCSQRKEDKTENKQTKNSIPGEIFVRITASKHKRNKRLRFNGKVIECSSSFIPYHCINRIVIKIT